VEKTTLVLRVGSTSVQVISTLVRSATDAVPVLQYRTTGKVRILQHHNLRRKHSSVKFELHGQQLITLPLIKALSYIQLIVITVLFRRSLLCFILSCSRVVDRNLRFLQSPDFH
jgi:hypothetical protein